MLAKKTVETVRSPALSFPRLKPWADACLDISPRIYPWVVILNTNVAAESPEE
jgi:hypothetical protein